MDENLNSYLEQEFMPLDENQVKWLLEIASKVKDLSSSDALTLNERSLLDVVSHQLIRLTSMTLAGFELYSMWNSLAKLLHQEILIAIENSTLNAAQLNLSQFPTVAQMVSAVEVDEDAL
jgi:hypothetical protein